ncbi:MAG: four helix bundle protein [Vicinamibacteria bacterium]|nr:four helix bundle protein [Vicinamibacteria bacterium]
MASTTTNSVHGTTGPRLGRLDAYRLAVEFHGLASRLELHGSGLGDQLRRASSSIVLCIAEGVGRVTAADRARFFAIARGSALECAAILDLLALDGRSAQILEAQRFLVRVIQTTTGLWRRQSG